jgi:hypothetical protein
VNVSRRTQWSVVLAALSASPALAVPPDFGPEWEQEGFPAVGPDPFEEYSKLGPGRDLSVLFYPIDVLTSSLSMKPMLGAEVRIALPDQWALAVYPVVVWYIEGEEFPAHGFGLGAMVSGMYFFERPLSGGFASIQVGDIEAYVAGESGRTVGAALVCGYAVSYDEGAMISVGLGIGYWYRMGVVGGGMSLPELLSLRLGFGWGESGPP